MSKHCRLPALVINRLGDQCLSVSVLSVTDGDAVTAGFPHFLIRIHHPKLTAGPVYLGG